MCGGDCMVLGAPVGPAEPTLSRWLLSGGQVAGRPWALCGGLLRALPGCLLSSLGHLTPHHGSKAPTVPCVSLQAGASEKGPSHGDGVMGVHLLQPGLQRKTEPGTKDTSPGNEFSVCPRCPFRNPSCGSSWPSGQSLDALALLWGPRPSLCIPTGR